MEYRKPYPAANSCKIIAVQAEIQKNSANQFKQQGNKDYL